MMDYAQSSSACAAKNKQGTVGRLEVLMRERMERIDALTGTIERLRDQNKRLDAENEHLVEMMRAV